MLRSIASTRKNPVKLGGACRSTSTRLAHTPPAHGPPFYASLRAPSAVRHTVYNGIRGFSTTQPVSAIIPFKLHDIGEGITEVEMLKWKVTEGQRVDHFDDLCEVQSDKSTAELTSPTPGIVHSIKVQEGDTVKVGQTLCEIRTDDGEGEGEGSSGGGQVEASGGGRPHEEQPTPAPAPPSPPTASAPTSPPASHTATDRNHTEASHHEQRQPQHHHHHQEEHHDSPMSTAVQFTGEASILPSAPPPTTQLHSGPVPPRQAREGHDTPRSIVLSSPAVRALAGRLRIDLHQVKGTGEKGRVTREDVERFHRSDVGVGSHGSGGSTSTQRGDQAVRVERGQRVGWADTTKVDFGRTRKVMYRALGAQAAVPHFGYSHTLDLTPLIPYLRALNPPATNPSAPSYIASDIPATLSADPLAQGGATKTTLLSLLVKGLLLALEEHPVMRAKVISNGDDKHLEIRKDGIIGLAVSDPKHGLVTPSLPALPPSTPLSEITGHLLAARKNPTKPGPSANLVVSSVGGLGEASGAMPVIPPGGPLAICAVGRARWEVEWKLRDAGMKVDPVEVEQGGTRAVLRCSVGWSGDHRVLEGAELIAFTESWKKWIEEPWRWIKIDG